MCARKHANNVACNANLVASQLGNGEKNTSASKCTQCRSPVHTLGLLFHMSRTVWRRIIYHMAKWRWATYCLSLASVKINPLEMVASSRENSFQALHDHFQVSPSNRTVVLPGAVRSSFSEYQSPPAALCCSWGLTSACLSYVQLWTTQLCSKTVE